jgi:hypothetical protein
MVTTDINKMGGLPLGVAGGGTGLTTATAANNAIYSTSATALAAGTLPVLAGGTGVTTSTGSGNNVLSTSPTLTTPTLSGNTTAGTINSTTIPSSDTLVTASTYNVAGKNVVINGGMDFWQRGTSFSLSGVGTYTADRWESYSTQNLTVTQIAPSLTNFQYATRTQRNSGNTSTASIYLVQSIETVNSIPIAGKSVTLSYWARCGANYSATSNLLTVQLQSGTGTDQNVLSGYTSGSNIISTTDALTTSWQQFTHTVTVGSTSTQLGVVFYEVPTGTAGANDYFDITGVQLELGSTATAFSRAGGSIGGELALCQRYYQKSYSQGTSPATATQVGSITYIAVVTAANNNQYTVKLPVSMRATPVIAIYPYTGTITAGNLNQSGGALVTITIESAGDSSFELYTTGAISAVGNYLRFHYTVSAEL